MKQITTKQEVNKYEGRIKNIDKGTWVTGWNEKRVTHTKDEKKAWIFGDEAIDAIQLLNKSFSDCYTLFDNVTPSHLEEVLSELTKNDTPEELKELQAYDKIEFSAAAPIRREEEGFTPGEWKVVKSGEAWAVKEWAALANVQYGGGDSEFVILGNTPTHTLLKMEAEANAKLIASAPTLYRDNVRLQEENKELKEVLGLMQKVAEMYITNTEKHPDSKMTKESTITHYFKEANLKAKALLNRDK